jgi:hypothetical protein
MHAFLPPRWLVPLLASLLAAGAAGAARADPGLMLAGGVRSGGGFESANASAESLTLRGAGAVSLAVEWDYDEQRLWQLWAARQRTRLVLASAAAPGTAGELPLTITTLHAGGVNYFDGPRGVGPYVAGGLGVAHMDPGLPGTSARTRASMSVGIGHEWRIGSIGSFAAPAAGPPRGPSIRLELRAHITLLNSSGGFFCSGGCTVFIRGDALTQLEALLGLRFAF